MPSTLRIIGQMKVRTLKAQFKTAFGVSIRVYKGKHFADDNATLASVRQPGTSGRAFEIHRNSAVKTVETAFLQNMGIIIQIEDAQGKLANNNATLAKVASEEVNE